MKVATLRLLAIIVVIVGLDQITKAIAVAYLKGQSSYSFLSDLFHLTYAENRGAFMSFGAGFSEGMRFKVFTVGVALFLIYVTWYTLKERLQGWSFVAMALLIGGGIGNLIDRALLSYVVDFMLITLGPVRTGVFNIADMAITLACLIFISEWAFSKSKKRPAKSH